MLKYFILCVFILSLTWQAFGEDPGDSDFGVNQFNDTDGNAIPLPRYAQLNINEKSYTFFYQPISWHAALELCSSQGQVLASVTKSDDNSKLINTLTQAGLLHSDSSFWLGASDLAHQGQYSWINNGRPVLYTNWRAGEPNNRGGNEHCLEMLSNGQWNDAYCYGTKYVICQRIPFCNSYSIPTYG